jgi:ribosomal protein L19E
MRFVDDQGRVARAAHIDEVGERRFVAVHAEQRLDDNESSTTRFRVQRLVAQQIAKTSDVVVRKDDRSRA